MAFIGGIAALRGLTSEYSGQPPGSSSRRAMTLSLEVREERLGRAVVMAVVEDAHLPVSTAM
jgi:hypothetical protein